MTADADSAAGWAWDDFVNACDLDRDSLVAALIEAAADDCCELQAALGLIVEQGSWVDRFEFRQAVDVWYRLDGRLAARVDWAKVDTDAPASSGELRILELARSLAGVPSPRSLRDLLWGLDEYNLSRVLRAILVAAWGTEP